MKIKYDQGIYKEIARFPINEIVQVESRKGRRSTIHITNITSLSWNELQLLIADGSDRFSKMVHLYKRYTNGVTAGDKGLRGVSLTPAETIEINRYIEIFRNQGFSKHTEVNDYISNNGLWDEFRTIRSLNDHGKFREIEGIQPKYFKVVCAVLKISGEGGLSLDSYRSY